MRKTDTFDNIVTHWVTLRENRSHEHELQYLEVFDPNTVYVFLILFTFF